MNSGMIDLPSISTRQAHAYREHSDFGSAKNENQHSPIP
jgi:hypothetical protein